MAYLRALTEWVLGDEDMLMYVNKCSHPSLLNVWRSQTLKDLTRAWIDDLQDPNPFPQPQPPQILPPNLAFPQRGVAELDEETLHSTGVCLCTPLKSRTVGFSSMSQTGKSASSKQVLRSCIACALYARPQCTPGTSRCILSTEQTNIGPRFRPDRHHWNSGPALTFPQ